MNSLTLNIPISFETSFNNSRTEANLIPKYLLPHSDSIELIIEVEVIELETNIVTNEEKRVVFHTTSNLPTFANNIKLSYPLEGMTNFYKDEVNEEFIVLKQILYDYIEGTEADLKIKLCPKGSNSGQDVPFTVVDYGKKFTFDISPLLSIETHYELKVFEIKSAQEGQSQSERELLSIPFRTSKFITFEDKVATFDPITEPIGPFGNSDFSHKIQFSSEPFDDIEINKKLVKAELHSENYRQDIYNIYRSYTSHGDVYVEEFCFITQFPGCFDCVPAGLFLTKDIGKYNTNWTRDYGKNVAVFLKVYMDQIKNGLGYLPSGDVYDFYLAASNFRSNNSSGVRAPTDPNMILMYFTPDGTKMSVQEVK
ncbi:MAG: hypothetical protein IPL08_14235 [Saprospiraceae bacterium]|nr:hypothetical protein [Saprospiraceae bacterium]